MNEEKIARICWNDKFWIKPSGVNGKSSTKEAFENNQGFGYEEWLLDISKLVNGYHYGFLQPIHKGWNKHLNKIYDISLYSINGNTKEKWWIGKIKNVHVISKDESIKIQKIYKQNDWLKEMLKQLKEVGINKKENNLNSLFCLKYLPSDLELLEEPARIVDGKKSIKAAYYVLMNKTENPKLINSINEEFVFRKGLVDKKTNPVSVYSKEKYEIEFLHNQMSKNIFKQLVEEYGKENVGTDINTGFGSLVDICLQNKNEIIFYELKTYNSAKKCIREAVGQLIEYSYYPNKERATKLVVVSQNKIDENIKNYLKFLRSRLNLPIYYSYYDLNNERLDGILY